MPAQAKAALQATVSLMTWNWKTHGSEEIISSKVCMGMCVCEWVLWSVGGVGECDGSQGHPPRRLNPNPAQHQPPNTTKSPTNPTNQTSHHQNHPPHQKPPTHPTTQTHQNR